MIALRNWGIGVGQGEHSQFSAKRKMSGLLWQMVEGGIKRLREVGMLERMY